MYIYKLLYNCKCCYIKWLSPSMTAISLSPSLSLSLLFSPSPTCPSLPHSDSPFHTLTLLHFHPSLSLSLSHYSFPSLALTLPWKKYCTISIYKYRYCSTSLSPSLSPSHPLAISPTISLTPLWYLPHYPPLLSPSLSPSLPLCYLPHHLPLQ